MSAMAASVVVMVRITPRISVPSCPSKPKYHSFPPFVCRIAGSRDFVAFFVELGAPMIVASTMVPALGSSFRSSSNAFTASNIRTVS